MKKYSLLLCALLLAIGARAQDLITLTNGATIHGKVIRITSTTVVCDTYNPGRVLTVKKTGIATLTYANGAEVIYNYTSRRDARMVKNGRKRPGNAHVHGWYFGLTASGGLGPVTNLNDPNYTVNNAYYDGFNFLATCTIGQHFGIRFGAGVNRYAYTVKYTNNSIYSGSSDLFVQRYGTLPIRVVYLSNSRRRLGIYATAGLDFSFLVSATDNFGDFMSSYYNNILISYYGSCGAVLRNRQATGIWMLGPFIKSSMNNIYSGESLRYESAPFLAAGNVGSFTSYGLTLSFMFNFEKLTQDDDMDNY